MQKNSNNNKNNKNDNNNFFNQNPLITFAIFSVVIILLFKTLVGENSTLNSGEGNQRTQQVSYSELKTLIITKSVSKVEIGQSYIKATSSDGSVYTTRIIRGDTDLVKELDKQGIEYTDKDIACVGCALGRNNKLREKLAELEHEQWSHWTKYLIKNFTEDNILKWGKQAITPYYQLSEKEKDSDRVWADKVLKLLKSRGVQNG